MIEQGNHQNAFEDLIVGHFDGNLSVDQERELAKAIAESPESKRLFLSYMRMEGRLHALVRDGFVKAIDIQNVVATAGSIESTTSQTAGSRPEESQHHSARSRLWAASSSVAVCAALIALIGWGLWPSSVNASTVLRRAQQAAADLVDRAYRVTLFDSSRKNARAEQELMINIRGDRLFAIQPTDGSYLMGRDGKDYWLTQRSGPVWVTEDFRTLAPELRRKIPNRGMLALAASPEEPLMMQVSSLLSLIETSYDIELLDSQNASENHIRATARSRRKSRPNTIEFWADTESGVVVRTELRWEGNRLARFELIDSQTLSDLWYRYSERAPDREVKRLEAGQ